MRAYQAGFALFCALGFAFCACSGDVPTGSTASSSGSGGAECQRLSYAQSGSDACELCLKANCCSELAACETLERCPHCVTYPAQEACTQGFERTLAIAVHDCGRAKCTQECAALPVGPSPADVVNQFCQTAGTAFCDALFACCTDPALIMSWYDSIGICKINRATPDCLWSAGFDDSYDHGIRGALEAGTLHFDQAKFDACVAGLKSMAAGGAACTAPVSSFFDYFCASAFQGEGAPGDACTPDARKVVQPELSFLPCKAGRCEQGKCVPFIKLGDTCSVVSSTDAPADQYCNYVNNEACRWDYGTGTGTCTSLGKTGDACDPQQPWDTCISGNCDATTQACALASPSKACY
jgi:hypothetical protein